MKKNIEELMVLIVQISVCFLHHTQSQNFSPIASMTRSYDCTKWVWLSMNMLNPTMQWLAKLSPSEIRCIPFWLQTANSFQFYLGKHQVSLRKTALRTKYSMLLQLISFDHQKSVLKSLPLWLLLIISNNKLYLLHGSY